MSRETFVLSVKTSFLSKWAPKGKSPDRLLAPPHDPVKIILSPCHASLQQGERRKGDRCPCVSIGGHGQELLLDVEEHWEGVSDAGAHRVIDEAISEPRLRPQPQSGPDAPRNGCAEGRQHEEVWSAAARLADVLKFIEGRWTVSIC